MTCLKAQAMITPFIENKLTIKELEAFLEHVNSCPNCREELEVYYALLTAMKQLDEDKNLSSNYSKELAEKLEKSRERVNHSKYSYYRKKVILILTMLLLAILFGIGYVKRDIIVDDIEKESDFRLRIQYRYTGDDLLNQSLSDYQKQQQSNMPTMFP